MDTIGAGSLPVLSHQFVTPKQVVRMLPGLTLHTLAQWRYRQQGPPYRKLGATILYPVDLLDKWVEAHGYGDLEQSD